MQIIIFYSDRLEVNEIQFRPTLYYLDDFAINRKKLLGRAGGVEFWFTHRCEEQ